MVDRVYYINLDRRPDRNINVKKILTKHELFGHRISAVDGTTLDINNISRDIISNDGIKDANNKNKEVYVYLTPGAIGCALSHRKIWQEIIDKKLNSVLILEDDIKFDPEFKTKYNRYIKLFPQKYDILFLGYHPSTHSVQNQALINSIFKKPYRVYGLFGYIVSYEGAKKLIDLFPLSHQIDSVITGAIQLNMLNAYIVDDEYRIIFSEPSEIASTFGTDIQNREHFSNYDKQQVIFFDLLTIFLFIFLIVIIVSKYYKYK